MKKKVCHISTAHTDNDSRILLKECQSLSNAGYDVSYIVTTDNDRISYGVNLIKLSNNNKGRINRVISKGKEAYKKALELDADIYHFHDPELISLGKKLKKAGKTVIYDVHEDVPKQILCKKYLGPIFLRKCISKVFNIYEKYNAKAFDAIVAATDEIADNFNHKKALSIKNYAMKNLIDSVDAIKNERHDKIICIYVGSITEIRGIKEVIESMYILQGKAELWVLGTWESENLFNQCKNLKGFEYTKYFGALPLKDVYKYTKAADLGLCTLYPTANYVESIPIKVLEYMASSKPIILSDFKYWKNYFGDIGEYVNPNEPRDIANAIETYIENPNKLKSQGKKNREMFIENFSWDSEEKKLINLYREL